MTGFQLKLDASLKLNWTIKYSWKYLLKSCYCSHNGPYSLQKKKGGEKGKEKRKKVVVFEER